MFKWLNYFFMFWGIPVKPHGQKHCQSIIYAVFEAKLQLHSCNSLPLLSMPPSIQPANLTVYLKTPGMQTPTSSHYFCFFVAGNYRAWSMFFKQKEVWQKSYSQWSMFPCRCLCLCFCFAFWCWKLPILMYRLPLKLIYVPFVYKNKYTHFNQCNCNYPHTSMYPFICMDVKQLRVKRFLLNHITATYNILHKQVFALLRCNIRCIVSAPKVENAILFKQTKKIQYHRHQQWQVFGEFSTMDSSIAMFCIQQHRHQYPLILLNSAQWTATGGFVTLFNTFPNHSGH